jgi:signal transduction histidine kinase/ActR/RegA family two-component response regulator
MSPPRTTPAAEPKAQSKRTSAVAQREKSSDLREKVVTAREKSSDLHEGTVRKRESVVGVREAAVHASRAKKVTQVASVAAHEVAGREKAAGVRERAVTTREGVTDRHEESVILREGVVGGREDAVHGRETHALSREKSTDAREVGVGKREGLERLNGALRHANEQLVIAAVHLQTVTEQRQAEAVYRQRQADQIMQLQLANQVKISFLANMSHELRTPLNAIIGFGELLATGEAGPLLPQQQEFLGDILTSGRHLLMLISDILDLSDIEAGKIAFTPEPVDLATLVDAEVSTLSLQIAQKHIRVETVIDPALAGVRQDPQRLQKVLDNFLSNAVKFSPDGGVIHVVVTPADDGMFQLRIDDAGPGIPAEDLPRLFIEFGQLDESRAKNHQGTGLGLALAKRLVEAQHGYVGVRSAPGHGSSFCAALPLVAEGPPRTGRTLSALLMPRADAPTVLVIEPDLEAGAGILRTLVCAGYGAQHVATAAEAMERLKTRQFDAITLGLLLPDANGIDLLPAIRELFGNAKVPIVIVSAIQPKELGLDVQDVLIKPLGPEELTTALARAGVTPGLPLPHVPFAKARVFPLQFA